LAYFCRIPGSYAGNLRIPGHFRHNTQWLCVKGKCRQARENPFFSCDAVANWVESSPALPKILENPKAPRHGGGLGIFLFNHQTGMRMTLHNPWPAKIALTIEECIVAGGIGRRTLTKAIAEKRLPAAFVNGRWRIAPSALERYLAGLPPQADDLPRFKSISVSARQ
jgi:excisionase family DNA binding protein